jgi:CheY-like chemotaxis protein
MGNVFWVISIFIIIIFTFGTRPQAQAFFNLQYFRWQYFNKIDLILLDYKLSDMLGDYVARKIRSYGGTKIVLISAYDLDTKLIQELEDGNYIRKFVKKPIDMDQR